MRMERALTTGKLGKLLRTTTTSAVQVSHAMARRKGRLATTKIMAEIAHALCASAHTIQVRRQVRRLSNVHEFVTMARLRSNPNAASVASGCIRSFSPAFGSFHRGPHDQFRILEAVECVACDSRKGLTSAGTRPSNAKTRINSSPPTMKYAACSQENC
jgi:hypothetical protein